MQGNHCAICQSKLDVDVRSLAIPTLNCFDAILAPAMALSQVEDKNKATIQVGIPLTISSHHNSCTTNEWLSWLSIYQEAWIRQKGYLTFKVCNLHKHVIFTSETGHWSSLQGSHKEFVSRLDCIKVGIFYFAIRPIELGLGCIMPSHGLPCFRVSKP